MKYEPTEEMKKAAATAYCGEGLNFDYSVVPRRMNDALSAALAVVAEDWPTEEDREAAYRASINTGFNAGWETRAAWHRSRYVAKEETLKEIPLTVGEVMNIVHAELVPFRAIGWERKRNYPFSSRED